MEKRPIILMVGIVIVLLQSCNFPEAKLRKIKFKPAIQEVACKYKKQLEPEIIHIGSGWFQFDTLTTHRVKLTIFNSDKLPKELDEKEKLALNIVSEVYPLIENKDDFSVIEIVFT